MIVIVSDLCRALPLIELRMTEAWLTWKTEYLRTKDGILMATQTGVGLLGGIVSVSLEDNTDIESFVYWMTFFVSGIFLLSYCSSLIETVKEKIPKINTIVISKTIFFSFKNFTTFIATFLPGHLVILPSPQCHLQIRLLECHLGKYKFTNILLIHP